MREKGSERERERGRKRQQKKERERGRPRRLMIQDCVNLHREVKGQYGSKGVE